MQSELAELFLKIIIPALVKTLYMVLATTVSATALGFILAVIIVVTDKDGLRPNKYINEALSTLVNVVRSFPFIILMVTIIPFTRLVMGTSIGEKAAIVPLTVAAAPFVARIIENALKEVDKSLIEVARSFGASDMQIILKSWSLRRYQRLLRELHWR
jgi:D-methionine transport system permease protein